MHRYRKHSLPANAAGFMDENRQPGGTSGRTDDEPGAGAGCLPADKGKEALASKIPNLAILIEVFDPTDPAGNPPNPRDTMSTLPAASRASRWRRELRQSRGVWLRSLPARRGAQADPEPRKRPRLWRHNDSPRRRWACIRRSATFARNCRGRRGRHMRVGEGTRDDGRNAKPKRSERNETGKPPKKKKKKNPTWALARCRSPWAVRWAHEYHPRALECEKCEERSPAACRSGGRLPG